MGSFVVPWLLVVQAPGAMGRCHGGIKQFGNKKKSVKQRSGAILSNSNIILQFLETMTNCAKMVFYFFVMPGRMNH